MTGVATRFGVDVDLDELIALRVHGAGVDLGAVQRSSAAAGGTVASRFRGRGMEYAESRPYLPGDDIRTMDWRVTARSTRPHTKVFQRERERPVFLVVDLAPSMFFATRGAFKSVLASRVAALIAWSAAARGDRVGALVVHRRRHREVPARGGHRGALATLSALAAAGRHVAEPATDRQASGDRLATALARARRVARPGSLVVVLSDFYDLDEDCRQHLRRLAAHNDLLGVLVVDPVERTAPPPGRYAVSDGRHETVLDTADDGLRAAYAEHHRERRQALAALLIGLGGALVELSTDDDPMAVLARGAAARACRARARG